jgi:hypothetical protein
MRDMTKNVQAKRVLSPVSVADNTAQVGQVIDHQGYNGALYTILIGSVADADATFTVLLEESDASGSGYAAVADADMNSQGANAAETDAAFQFDDDNEVRKIGYIGQKRYTRLTITPASNASAAVLAAVCHLGYPSIKAVTQAAS